MAYGACGSSNERQLAESWEMMEDSHGALQTFRRQVGNCFEKPSINSYTQQAMLICYFFFEM
jgi:hypothetical protein